MRRDDEKWIRHAQKGSRKAFDKLVRKYTAYIFRLLFDMVGDYEDAQDLTQDVFIKTFMNIQKYRGEARFSTWLYRIAYNVGIDFIRGRKRAKRIGLDSVEKTFSVYPHNLIRKGEYTGEKEAIEKALQKLTRPQLMAVILNYYHGFRMREVGEIIGCSEGTVRVHLFRALKKLRKELNGFSSEV